MRFTEGILIVRGNLSLALYPEQDNTSHPTTNPDNRYAKTLQLLHHHPLTDCWIAQNPTTRDYTFYSLTHVSYSRLDYFLVPHYNLTLLIESDILPMTWSDCPLHLRLRSHLFRPRQTSWLLKESILSNSTLVETTRKTLHDYFTTNETGDMKPLTCWETHKVVVQGHFIAICSTRKK
ncbi:Hypothetical predicted protein [Pelobates cultripes]|uniref:Uncharacterized protein n=1 Tax=Pelobates cultripes TaxID=61616 RepID=A0AAD1SED6_PELCU|nr:Hypothetical predicted protein [Pelobates cultripes]